MGGGRRQTRHKSAAAPCILYRFATTINHCIDCELACTCGNSFLLFSHRRLLSQSLITASPVPGLCEAKFVNRFLEKVGRVGRYLRDLGMPPLTVQEEGLTKGTSCPSHCPMSGAS